VRGLSNQLVPLFTHIGLQNVVESLFQHVPLMFECAVFVRLRPRVGFAQCRISAGVFVSVGG
jgi:hypothetical protein